MWQRSQLLFGVNMHCVGGIGCFPVASGPVDHNVVACDDLVVGLVLDNPDSISVLVFDHKFPVVVLAGRRRFHLNALADELRYCKIRFLNLGIDRPAIGTGAALAGQPVVALQVTTQDHDPER